MALVGAVLRRDLEDCLHRLRDTVHGSVNSIKDEEVPLCDVSREFGMHWTERDLLVQVSFPHSVHCTSSLNTLVLADSLCHAARWRSASVSCLHFSYLLYLQIVRAVIGPPYSPHGSLPLQSG